MKKTRTSFAKARKISGFIAAIMLLSLAACGNTENQLEAPSTDATTEVTTVSETTTTEPTTTSTTTEVTTTEQTTTTTKKTTTATEPVTTTTTTTTQQPVTTTTARPTTMPNGNAQGGGRRNNAVTTTKVTTTKHQTAAPSEVPQDVNPGQWRKDPGITAADLKAAAEAAFAKVKKTATDYGWTISKTFVNRSTNTQYGIYFRVDIAKGSDGKQHTLVNTLKVETDGKSATVQTCDLEYGRDGQTDTNYADFCYAGPVEDTISFLKEYGVKKIIH